MFIYETNIRKKLFHGPRQLRSLESPSVEWIFSRGLKIFFQVTKKTNIVWYREDRISVQGSPDRATWRACFSLHRAASVFSLSKTRWWSTGGHHHTSSARLPAGSACLRARRFASIAGILENMKSKYRVAWDLSRARRPAKSSSCKVSYQAFSYVSNIVIKRIADRKILMKYHKENDEQRNVSNVSLKRNRKSFGLYSSLKDF